MAPLKLEVNAALSTAAGDGMLQVGTRLDKGSNSTDESRILLPGLGLDLGGPALEDYLRAGKSLDKAKKLLENQGASQDDIGRVEEESKVVADKISAVYGPHDILDAHRRLVDYLGKADDSALVDINRLLILLSRSAVFGTQDDKLKAKLNRDLALIETAMAEHYASKPIPAPKSLEVGPLSIRPARANQDAAMFAKDAGDRLAAAKQGDPTATDNLPLEAIIARLPLIIKQSK